jgi:transglutaminase-like putative cysteine protease
LQAVDVPALARVLEVPPPAAGATTLDYTLGDYREISGDPARTWLEETFVVDYRDPEVAQLQAAFAKTTAGRPWARQDLVDFVAASMTVSLGQPFEIASQVAHSRHGDCKNYAVLTAALARSAGVPARVAVGLVLIGHDGRYAAYGHAWAETREAGHWVVADSTRGQDQLVVRYLPLGIINDEGPGFQLPLMRLTPAMIQRLAIVGATYP